MFFTSWIKWILNLHYWAMNLKYFIHHHLRPFYAVISEWIFLCLSMYAILWNNFSSQSEKKSAKYPHYLMLLDLSDAETGGMGAGGITSRSFNPFLSRGGGSDLAQPLLLAPPHFSPFRHPWIPFIDATKIEIKDIEFGQWRTWFFYLECKRPLITSNLCFKRSEKAGRFQV